MIGNKTQGYINIFIILFLCISLTSCQSSSGNLSYRELSKEDRGNIKYRGHYKIGKKYTINNKSYQPKEVTSYSRVGIASWYGTRYNFHNNHTANGDIYNKNLLTAAHKTLQLPSLVKVTNLENGKSIIVLVNDRGPYAQNRIIDLSEKAAEVIGMKNKGTAKVKIKYLHAESQKFLKYMGLSKKHGSRSTVLNSPHQRCSINCHIKLVNIKHGIKVGK